jgi:peptidyl-tRNA hydrolase, PTH1 family
MRPSWRVRDGHAGARRFTVLKVVVGLGNPGKQYEQTRHNVGWMVLDRLADRAGWGGTVKARDAAAVTRGRYRGLDLVLVKPTTFMNESGIAVRKALARERSPLEDLLVVVDDFALPFGKLRMRERGSAGSHNGLRSIIGELESDEFARLRVGIGEPSRNAVRHVLTRFSEDERVKLDLVLDAAADAVEDWARDGPSKASNRWNTWQLPEDVRPAASSAAHADKSDLPAEGGIRRTRTGWRRLLPG